MEYKVLYRKYRPQDFDSVIGQEYTITLLKKSIMDGKISHAYIFTGPRGTGKTSTAKIFAKAINCLHNKNGNPCNKCDNCNNFSKNPDIIEIDAASNNGVDDVREIIENVRLVPAMSKYKVYIIDEFHMLSTSAFNALLLTLEEPPENVVFILATTDIQSVPITILSRCQRFDFKPISNEKIVDNLKNISKTEKIDISNEALQEISYMSNGGMRDALSVLDQISSKDGKIEADDVVNNFGSVSKNKIDELIESLNEQNIERILEKLKEFKLKGVDHKILVDKLIDQLKNELIMIQTNTSKYHFDFNNVYNLIMDLNNDLYLTSSSVNPYILIELSILKYLNISREIISNYNNNVESEKNIETKPENIVLDAKQEEKIAPKQEKSNKKEQKVSKSESSCNINIDIRVNNCFVNAKKEYLSKIKEKWDDFLIYESNANKKIMSFIMDTDIVTASDKYAILLNENSSTSSLINENIKSLEQDFKIFYGMEYKFVCLDGSMWNNFKEKYIFNIKNKIKYSIIDEEAESLQDLDATSMPEENSDELEKLASEIFDNQVEIR